MKREVRILDRHTGREYTSRREAAEALGISYSTMGKYIRGELHWQEGRFEEVVTYPEAPEHVIDKSRLESCIRNPSPNQIGYSLCTVCQNCRCSWVQRFQPVEGWRATGNPTNESYTVYDCPEYKGREEESHAKRII